MLKVKKKKTNLSFYEIQQNIMVIVNISQRKSVTLFYTLVKRYMLHYSMYSDSVGRSTSVGQRPMKSLSSVRPAVHPRPSLRQ